MNLPLEEVRRLCEPGGSLLLHGAEYCGGYYVVDRSVERWLEVHELVRAEAS